MARSTKFPEPAVPERPVWARMFTAAVAISSKERIAITGTDASIVTVVQDRNYNQLGTACRHPDIEYIKRYRGLNKK